MDTQTAAADGLVAVPKTSRSRQVSAATPNRSTPSRKDRRLDQRRVGVDWKGAQDKKLRRNLKSLETKYQNASQKARDAEVLLENTAGFLEPEGELERTYRVRQEEVRDNAALDTAHKRFELKLDALGPYMCEYSRNGRQLLLAGRRGHVASFNWREGSLACELQLGATSPGEIVRDIKWLHGTTSFAVAQRQNVYLYDQQGLEIHQLSKARDVTRLEFLPYHLLLVLASQKHLNYTDVSTGHVVAEINTKIAGVPLDVVHNPYNAVIHVGHQNGTVTLWSPSSPEPLVKLLAHKGPVRSLAVDRSGRYMVSAGADMKMSVWDIRQFKELGSYFTRSAASSVAISDTGLTAVGWGTRTTVWNGLFSHEKVQSPYMALGGEGKRVERLRFCPFEDVLGIGHDQGFESMLLPGAGQANFDALEANPFETTKQRQEAEVKALLNKLKPEMIALDPNFIGNLDLRSDQQRQADKDEDAPPIDAETEIRNKARGKKSALKKYLRKQRKKNIIDEKRLKVDEIWKEQQQHKQVKRQEKQEELGPALARFVRKD